MEGSERVGLRNNGRDRLGSLCGYGAGMPKQLRKRGPAYAIREKHSESERGERRANQHQRINCVLHVLNTLPFEQGSPSIPELVPAILPMLFLTEVATR